ncbi:MAG TPA: 6-hydroxymethylpterin diphosphokinase MptE-like protein [Terriglobales bacterium]
MKPFNLEVNQFGTAEEIQSHIRNALSLGLPEFSPALCSHDGTFVVVGSGPSLLSTWEGLKEERAKGRPICSIKGTHNFLIERGLNPDLWLTIDPRPRLDQLNLKSDQTIYLVSSRCHPEIFERLKDDKVILWHSYAEQDKADAIFEEVEQKNGKAGIFAMGGGTTSGIRCIYLAFAMGFRNFVLYGMDSSLGKDGTTKRFNGDKSGKIVEIKVGSFKKDDEGNETEEYDAKSRTYLANTAMAQQAKDFQRMYEELPGIHIEAKGDGLIPAIIEKRKQMGLPS